MKTDEAPEQLLVSIKETCKILNQGRTTIYGLLGSGQLDSVKIGKRRPITMASINRLVERSLKNAGRQ